MFDLSKKGVDGVKKEAGGILSWLIRCLQGAIVGTGAILPGVSGGVLCVAFGIYEPMMALLSHPIRSFREYYRMFIPILLGWAAGFVLLAGLVEKLFEMVNFVAEQNAMRITTGMLNSVLADATARVQPPTDKGRRLKIYYMTQIGIKPPTFVCFCNDARLFHFSYLRYLENRIREVFALTGTPIKMIIRQKGED